MIRSLSSLLNTLEAQIGPVGLVGLLFGLAALLGFIFGASLMGIVGASRKRRVMREAEEEQELIQNLLNDTRLNSSRLQAENNKLKTNAEEVNVLGAKHERELRQLNTELNAAQMLLAAKETKLSEKDGLLAEHQNSLRVAAGQTPNPQEVKRAVQQALEKGRNEGLQAGLTDGIEKGRSEGREFGRKEGLTEGLEVGRKQGLAEATAAGKRASMKAAGLGAASAASAVGAVGSMDHAKVSEPPTLRKRVLSGEESSLNTSEAGIIPDDLVIPTLSEAELTANVEAYDLSDLEELVDENL